MGALTLGPLAAVTALLVGSATGHDLGWPVLTALLLAGPAVAVAQGASGRLQSAPGTDDARRASTGLLLGGSPLACAVVVVGAIALAGRVVPDASPGAFADVAIDTAVAKGQERDAAALLRGTVTGADGRPMASAFVVVSHTGPGTDTCPSVVRATTRDDGPWLVPVCLSGSTRWLVEAVAGSARAISPPVELTAGTTATVDLVVR